MRCKLWKNPSDAAPYIVQFAIKRFVFRYIVHPLPVENHGVKCFLFMDIKPAVKSLGRPAGGLRSRQRLRANPPPSGTRRGRRTQGNGIPGSGPLQPAGARANPQVTAPEAELRLHRRPYPILGICPDLWQGLLGGGPGPYTRLLRPAFSTTSETSERASDTLLKSIAAVALTS